MAVAFDAATESVRTGTTDPHTFSHTPVGTPRGVVLSIIHGTESTDLVSSVTYGGVAMTRVATATDTATEPGRSYMYFLGAGIPTGAQTVSVDLTSATATDIEFVCSTVTASQDTAVIDSGTLSDNQANPSVTLNYSGTTAIAFAALYGGGAAPSSFTPNANCTQVASEDLGAFYGYVLRQTTPGSSNFAIGGTASSDDVAYVALAVTEIISRTIDMSGVLAPATAAPASPDGVDVTIGPLPAASTATSTAPGVGSPTAIAPTAAAATSSVSTPTLGITVAPSAAAATASSAAPVLGVTVSGVASATAAGLSPTIGLSIGPAAGAATAAVSSPVVLVVVAPSAAAATAAVTAPGVSATSGGTTIVATVAAATAGIATPDGVDVTVGADIANADAGVNGSPTVSIGSGSAGVVTPPAAEVWAVAQEQEPLPWLEAMGPPAIGITVSAQATATAAALSPTPFARVVSPVAIATATITSPAASVQITASAAEATASIVAPTAGSTGTLVVSPAAASASADAVGPLPLLRIVSSAATLTASITSPASEVLVSPGIAAATASVSSPLPTNTVSGAVAVATASSVEPLVIVPSSVTVNVFSGRATASVGTVRLFMPLLEPAVLGSLLLIPKPLDEAIFCSETTLCSEDTICGDGLVTTSVSQGSLVLTPA